MKQSSIQPGRLTPAQAAHVRYLFTETEIVPLSCLFWRMDTRNVIRLDRAVQDDFIYVPVTGALEFGIAGRWTAVAPGQAVLIPAGVRHGARMAAGTEYFEAYALHVLATDRWHHSVFKRLSSPVGSLSSPTSWFDRLATCTHLMAAEHDLGAEYMRRLVQELLLEQIVRGAGLQELPEPLDARVTLALHRVQQRFAEHLRIADLAAEVGLSPGRFRQLFRQSLRISPKQYLQQYRLARARALLKTAPGLTVREVAWRVGFNDAHNFHTAYRAAYGETPRGTRESGRAAP